MNPSTEIVGSLTENEFKLLAKVPGDISSVQVKQEDYGYILLVVLKNNTAPHILSTRRKTTRVWASLNSLTSFIKTHCASISSITVIISQT